MIFRYQLKFLIFRKFLKNRDWGSDHAPAPCREDGSIQFSVRPFGAPSVERFTRSDPFEGSVGGGLGGADRGEVLEGESVSGARRDHCLHPSSHRDIRERSGAVVDCPSS